MSCGASTVGSGAENGPLFLQICFRTLGVAAHAHNQGARMCTSSPGCVSVQALRHRGIRTGRCTQPTATPSLGLPICGAGNKMPNAQLQKN